MDLTPYLNSLRSDLTATAAPGGPDAVRAAELLGGALDSAARLCLMEALSDAAAEITAKLDSVTVEVRLRGRDADLVVTELRDAEPVAQPAPTTPIDTGDLARVTLRLPEPLKEQVERAAGTEGISVNSWLVRAISSAVTGGDRPANRTRGVGKRVTGFAQA